MSNTPNNSSHDYARCLQRAAEFLLARPSFAIDTTPCSFNWFRYYRKEDFIAAVKAVGSGKKGGDDKDIEFKVEPASGVEIIVSAPRATVCRLIRPAEFECDPFLSPEEEKSLGGAA